MINDNFQSKLDYFLVCGLGNLGQNCVVSLKEFGVTVIAIEQISPIKWEVNNLPNLLDNLILGDCRQNSVLQEAQIKQCRAALIVTSSEQVNTETALAVRQLNPKTRIVIRSAKTNLNHLLSQQLGNFIAFDPNQLPTITFALAALSTENLGFFKLDGQWLTVIKRQILKSDPWCYVRLLHELHSRTRRILAYQHLDQNLPLDFYKWEPDTPIFPQDILVYIETAEQLFYHSLAKSARLQQNQSLISRFSCKLQQLIRNFWQLNFQQQVRRVALVCGLTVCILLFLGTGLFYWYEPHTNLASAFYTTAILLLGGYGDLFGNIQDLIPLPWWLQLFSLGLTVAGTGFVGVLYALLTEALLSSQFQFIPQRPSIPLQNHVIIFGMGRVGQLIAAWLQEFKQQSVGIMVNQAWEQTILPDLPLITANLAEAHREGNLSEIAKANLKTAKSIVIVTDDDITNLEVALMAQTINPEINLVIRTSGQRLSEHISKLLPQAQVLDIYEIAAEAFAGAAFGENIINIFRLNNQTILVTEYQIEAGDTLNGLLLGEVAYGYGVVPILYKKPALSPQLMPSDDLRLAIGDRLVVLATIGGLQRVEQGKLNLQLKCWRVRIDRAFTEDAAFEGAILIARTSGCSLSTARSLMQQLPQMLPTSLYKHQAQRLVRELNKALVKATLYKPS